MRLFGFEITRKKDLSPVYGGGGFGFGNLIRESFPGAWQRNVVRQPLNEVTAFSAVYACVSLIAEDIAKLRPKLVKFTTDGIWVDVGDSPFWRPLVKPNRYQTRVQFLSQWMTSKLLYGNAYVLKEREPGRGMVRNMYVLDPRRVTPLVADDGSVWYQINQDTLNNVPNENVTVPADEIIHDRAVTLFHPLMGISPIYACGISATQGMRIQDNSESFFRNMSRPSGQLTSDKTIPEATAERLKRAFEENFSAGNIGRILVTGDNLKYEAFGIPAQDAQLIEQLDWTVQDVARAFRVPLHKLSGGEAPKFTNMAALNLEYYVQTLQSHIEAIEVLLDEGLEVVPDKDGNMLGVELDLEGLQRMDPGSLAESNKAGVLGGWMTPNEARRKASLPPIAGGDAVYLQQQNYSTEALAKRDSADDPFNSNKPPALPAPDNNPSPADSAADAKAFQKFMDETLGGIDTLWTT